MKTMRKVSKALEDYLEALYILELEDKPLHTTSVANKLQVSKPACTKAMKRLIELKYIDQKLYGSIFFTYQGRNIAKEIYHRHTIIKKFLMSLGIDRITSESDCCKIEHVISDKTLRAFEKHTKK